MGTGAVGEGEQGHSVSLSADGNTLAVGGQSDNSGVGATWIFTRNGTTWTQRGTKLVGTGAVGSSQQGHSVSLSSDGTTLAVGGYGDSNSAGATWIFTRSGTVWTQQGTKLVGTGAIGPSFQGTSVSLSADGNTLAVGGPYDNNYTGATWIYVTPPPPSLPRIQSGRPPVDNAFRYIYVGEFTGRPASDAKFNSINIGVNNWRGTVNKDGSWNHLN